jgi:hypothetical protein
MADALRFVPVTLRLGGLRRALLLLLTALVLVQTAGVLHRVVHAHGPISASSVSQQVASVTDENLVRDLQRLWGEHSNSAECQLFDQTCQDALSTPVVLLMPVLLPASWMTAALHVRFALVERFYAARGPPDLQ